MNMANIVISNVDEQTKQHFERFCTNTGGNTTTAFIKLVKIAIGINEQGLLILTADEAPRQTKTKSQRQGEALNRLLKTLDEIDDEPLDDEFFAIVNSGVSVRGVNL